jgi:hypothetical protein
VVRSAAARKVHTAEPMTPPSFNEFFAASAGVAGALIGLLFVALSVANARSASGGESPVHRVRASAALTSFLNALTVALFALVPGVGIRWPAFVVGVVGVLFVAGSLLSVRRLPGPNAVAPREITFLAGLLATFVVQLYFALRLVSNAGDVGAARGIAVLVIVCFLIGIARSWELVGGPTIAFTGELVALLRARGAERVPGDRSAQRPPDTVDEP